MENKIQIHVAIRAMQEYLKNPADTESAKSFEELKRSLVIRDYLTAAEKNIVLFRILMDADRDIDSTSSTFAMAMDLGCVFDGLLSYTNIDSTIPQEWKTYELYDMFHMSGLVDYILQYCRKDYERLVALVDRTVSFEHLTQLVDVVRKLDNKELKQTLAEFRALREDMDPNLIRDISDIVRYNDPSLYVLKTKLVDEAMEQLDRADKIEKTDKMVNN